MDYEERIAALFERHRSVQSSGFSAEAYKPGLEAMRRLDEALGSPSRSFRAVHVAGTNGKGSACTMISAALAKKEPVGLYTSPHLMDFRERMKIVSGESFEMISREEVTEFLDRFGSALEGLTFFEVTTGMAFWWFASRGIRTAVIETGLGGRLDSTNIVTPSVTVISSIGLDHCELLGRTRALIAAEKAGIFKSGVPAVVWGRDAETGTVFEEAARNCGAPLDFADGSGNEATVKLALGVLGRSSDFVGLEEASRITGFRGRWERIGNAILDIGHNPQALERNFRRLISEDPSPVIVYGVMADKDYRTVATLFPAGAQVILTQPSTPRALPLAALESAVRAVRPELRILTAPDVASATTLARSIAGNHLIYIGGSTYVVCEAIEK